MDRGRIESSIRAALDATYRERCRFALFPWHAYVGRYGGVIVARIGDPEEPVDPAWAMIGPVDNSRTNDGNVPRLADAMSRMALADAQDGAQ